MNAKVGRSPVGFEPDEPSESGFSEHFRDRSGGAGLAEEREDAFDAVAVGLYIKVGHGVDRQRDVATVFVGAPGG
ncbi:hypothetical protein [Actinoplanes sandaracinus]